MTSTAISSAPPRRKTGQLTANPLFQQDAHSIIRRRAKAAGIETRIGNHTFRETGITAYLKPPSPKGDYPITSFMGLQMRLEPSTTCRLAQSGQAQKAPCGSPKEK
jgi:hypothetical protein